MDENRMQQADAAYAAGDWRVAAREYLSAAGAGGKGSGVAFHKAGNALMKLRRFDDAVTVYTRALDDTTYERVAALNVNLATALSSAGNNARAVEVFERALADRTYDSRYRALQGMASALIALGRGEEACDAYRRAALDDANPDPGKALNNLGMCAMSLGRPEDAIEAFKAAISSDGYAGKGKASVNLGLAYASVGRHADAVRAFDRATGEFAYTLNDAALAAYDAARAVLDVPRPEIVEGWSTGEMSPVPAAPAAMTVADDADVTAFFSRTDEEMLEVDKAARRAERAERRESRNVWITVGTWVAIAALVVGAVAFAWVSGLGYPTQEMTVNGLLDAHKAGKAVEPYWVAVPTADVEKEMSNLPPKFESATIGAIERSARTSSVDVTVVLEQGAPLSYKVSLVREGVGWKVNGLSNDWRSTGGGS